MKDKTNVKSKRKKPINYGKIVVIALLILVLLVYLSPFFFL